MFTFLKVNRFHTFSKSADCLHSKSQLITKTYLNREEIDLFAKILVLVKNLGKGRRRRKKFQSLEVREASSLHLIMGNFLLLDFLFAFGILICLNFQMRLLVLHHSGSVAAIF